MKKIAVSLFSITLLLTGCSKNSTSDIDNTGSTEKVLSQQILDELDNDVECNPLLGNETEFSSIYIDKKAEDEYINTLAAMHNEFLEYFYNEVLLSGNNIPSTNFLNLYHQKAKDFFDSRKIHVNDDYYNCISYFEGIKDSFPVMATYGAEFNEIVAQEILVQLDQLSNSETLDGADEKLSQLYLSANNISDKEERLIMKFTLKIARESYAYWTENYTKWETLVDGLIVIEDAKDEVSAVDGIKLKPTDNQVKAVKAAAGADFRGALRGGILGLGGGVAGAFAGALVGAGVKSCMAIIGSAVISKVK